MRLDERRALVVEAVLVSTLAVLEDVGFNRLRIADVAAHSGVSEGKLFRHFSSKNDLLRAALDRSLEEHRARIVEAFVALGGGPVTRRDMLQLLWDATDHPQIRWTNELYASASLDPELGPILGDVLSSHNAGIDTLGVAFLRATGVEAGDHGETLVNMISWSMQGLAINDHGRGGTDRHEALIEYLLLIAEAAFGPEPVAQVVHA
jgi:AcrR family transcriptional regulator